ncbi:MAG: type VI secretion system membrane subunit TssM [Alphaproteobacteria bacterium]|nr:type VI secretion system membrane subunit TssM [Alphaproteobacteria bacterium]
MSTLGRIFTSRWFLSFIGLVALALVVWFAGPLIGWADAHPLEDWPPRLGAVLLIAAVWAGVNVWLDRKAAKADRKLVEGLTAGTERVSSDALATEEVEALRQRLKGALDVLRKSATGRRRGSQHLYELPWYVVIGPPGAGKTTALVNSGLKFPMAEVERKPVRGVGGTRNCDWWFSDEAILIDTAGRYFSQDSHAEVDQAAWSGFVDLLAKYRPRQPLNGLIVAFPVPELLGGPEARLAHARMVRTRVLEIYDRLGLRLPIYLLLTKADLVPGFVEYFDELDVEGRKRVLGTTFDFGSETVPAEAFATEFDALVDRLRGRLLTRIHQERNLDRRSAIFGFPEQLAGLRGPLDEFLAEAFGANRFQTPPLLRGVYFSSGTQEGTPIDRLMNTLAQSLGLSAKRAAPQKGGRSYFLTDLLREVMFAEASVVGRNPRLERRRALLRGAALAAIALASLAMAGVWTMGALGNRALIAEVDAATAAYAVAVEPHQRGAITDPGLATVLPLLDSLRALPAGYGERADASPWWDRFGLSQREKLERQAISAYRRGLDFLLAPRLAHDVQRQIRDNLQNGDQVYRDLAVALMLGGRGPLDAQALRDWFAHRFEELHPGPANEAFRQGLLVHVDALAEERGASVELDAGLIAEARMVVKGIPSAKRCYARLRESHEARHLPDWTVIDKAGAAADRVFVRRGGESLAAGIPGLYTNAGFNTVFLPNVLEHCRAVISDRWIEDDAEAARNESALAQLVDETATLYLTDYAAQWSKMLGDIALVPFSDIAHAADVVNKLAGPGSPMRALLKAVAHETALVGVPVALDAAKQVSSTIAKTVDKVQRVAGALPQARYVDDRFRQLHRLVEAPPNGTSQLDGVMHHLNEVYLHLVRLSGQLGGERVLGAATGADAMPIQLLAAERGRLPAPVSEWVQAVVVGATASTMGGARAELNAAWGPIAKFCEKAVEGRYPLAKGSANDVTLDDFSRLFAAQGMIGGFFDQRLATFVDTSRTPWRPHRLEGAQLEVSSDTLAQFQRAAAIRDAFFGAGATAPQLRFEVELKKGTGPVTIEVDGTVATLSAEKPMAALSWPGTGPRQARLTLGDEKLAERAGPWALFRLLDTIGASRGAASDRLVMAVKGKAGEASLELRASSSVNNPFALPELTQFKCPRSL